MGKKIRILALILTVVMLIGVIPLTAFALVEPEEEMATDLDKLVALNEGEIYEMPSYESYQTYLGTTASNATGTNGRVFTDGSFVSDTEGGAAKYKDTAGVKSMASSMGPNRTANCQFIYTNGESQLSNIIENGDISFMFAGRNINLNESEKYLVFSMDVKRGEGMKNGYLAKFRYYDCAHETIFAQYKNGKISAAAGTSKQLDDNAIYVPFSTEVFTNITVIYNLDTGYTVGYVNGIKTNEYTSTHNHSSCTLEGKFCDILWQSGNTAKAYDGRLFSLKTVRAYTVNDDATLANCVTEATNLANGVFKVGNDYYLYENNIPVIGETRVVSGYTVTTEANTGKIVSCYENTAENVTTYGKVFLKGSSVTLGEKLGMNFYAKLPVGITKAVVTTADGATEYTDFTAGEDGFTKFTSKISSIQAREDITIEFFDASGEAVEILAADKYESAYTTTVYSYAKSLIAGEYSEAEKNAAQALIDYVAYAENYFTKEFDIAAVFPDATAELGEVNAVSKLKVVGDASILGDVQLVLDDATKIKVFLNSAPESFEDSETIKLIGNSYIEISGIDAKNLDTGYTFTVGGATVTIAVTDIASVVIEANANAKFVNLMKALYLYSEACNELAGA